MWLRFQFVSIVTKGNFVRLCNTQSRQQKKDKYEKEINYPANRIFNMYNIRRIGFIVAP